MNVNAWWVLTKLQGKAPEVMVCKNQIIVTSTQNYRAEYISK